MKKLFLKIFLLIFGSFVGLLISIFNKELALIFLMFLYFTYSLQFIVWMRDRVNNSEIKSNLELVKKSSRRYYNLFTWLGEDKSSDRIIYELVGDIIEKPNTIETLRLLKCTLEEKIDGELVDYYMIKQMIQNSRKENFGEFFQGIVNKIVLGSIGITIITALINKKKLDIFNFKELNLFNSIIITIFIVLIFIGFLSIIYLIIFKSRKRANLILMILDEIIKEKEAEKNT